MQIGSLVLAGGRSRRMGQPKEGLRFRRNTLLGHAVETLLSCTFPVVVIGRDEDQELPPLPLEAEVVFDDDPGAGPLCALRDGMRHAGDRCDALLVTGCDFPFLTPDVVFWLSEHLGGHDLVIPKVGGILQPLVAIYRVRLLPLVEEMVAAGDRMPRDLVQRADARVLEEADVDAFDPDRRFLRNVNSIEEYRAALDET